MPLSGDLAPAADQRRNQIDRVMQRHAWQPDGLIEILHAAQESYGFLETGTLAYIAAKLAIAPARVYGVATFYNHFRLKPRGRHTLSVCTGTACHVKGNDRLLAWLNEHFGLKPGETTADSELSLVEVRCVGACALAPVFLTDQTLVGKATFAGATEAIRTWLNNAH